MNFDFNKKDEPIIVDEKSPMLEKKKIEKKTLSVPKLFNVNLDVDKMPKGFWAAMIAVTTIFCMSGKVEDAGWGLLLAFLMLDKRKGIVTFLLAFFGLVGMYGNIEGAGWLLFFAFLV